MSKKILNIACLFVIGMIGGIFADQIFWPYFVERPLFHQYRLEQSPVYVSETKNITVRENTALVDAVNNVGKSVAGIRAKSPAGVFIEGSGLIITSDGLMVTFADLVPQGYDFTFFVEGKEAAYQILKRDLQANLALVKLEKSNLQAVKFADLDKIKVGERVFLVGIIFEKKKPKTTANEGVVRNFTADSIKTNIFENYTLTGSSLFNISAETLGLNRVDSFGKITTIPISTIREFVGM